MECRSSPTVELLEDRLLRVVVRLLRVRRGLRRHGRRRRHRLRQRLIIGGLEAPAAAEVARRAAPRLQCEEREGEKS